MTENESRFQAKLRSGGQLVVVEIAPPKGSDPAPLKASVKRFGGRAHAIGVSDNRHGVRMSALAAASLITAEGGEAILHVVTRDSNRIALISNVLGAQAMGVRNILCTSGTHQTLGVFPSAKNVFDIDSIQLLEAIAHLANSGSRVCPDRFEGIGSFCLGAVAAPFADPAELQLIRLAKKVNAGARFLVTQPVYDLDRFRAWWGSLTQKGIHEKVAVLAGVQPLLDRAQAKAFAESRPSPVIPEGVLARLSSAGSKASERAAGIEIAVETIRQISGLGGVRGFQISAEADEDAALEIMERSGLEAR